MKVLMSILTALGSLVATPPQPQVIVSPQVRVAHVNHRAEVNALHYNLGNPVPAMKAFALVAQDEGWSKAKIKAWSPFAKEVMKGESMYCYTVRRAAVMAADGTCRVKKQSTNSDAGFAQVIRRYFYGPKQFLCTGRNICTAKQIVQEPYVSMLTFVLSIDRYGSQPWCYAQHAKRYRCRLAPDR
jgi:hypothetical protein